MVRRRRPHVHDLQLGQRVRRPLQPCRDGGRRAQRSWQVPRTTWLGLRRCATGRRRAGGSALLGLPLGRAIQAGLHRSHAGLLAAVARRGVLLVERLLRGAGLHVHDRLRGAGGGNDESAQGPHGPELPVRPRHRLLRHGRGPRGGRCLWGRAEPRGRLRRRDRGARERWPCALDQLPLLQCIRAPRRGRCRRRLPRHAPHRVHEVGRRGPLRGRARTHAREIR
mmetsp:Transcript_0/g.4  ORF Transcript_0/g.4 Transcript_0/m.4 type:complete len:224 (+) Transcript_0:1153-1824(+)